MRKKHRIRTLRNTVIILLLAAAIWATEGYDLPTMEMEMHRSERQHMIEESRVIWEYKGKQYRDRDMLVGLGPQYVTTYHESYAADFWPRAVEEPTLVLLPESTRYSPDGKGHSYLDPAFLAVDAPARAQSARLSILLDYDNWAEVYAMAGERQGAVWFFQLEQRYRNLPEDATWEEKRCGDMEESAFSLISFAGPEYFGIPCTLEFFDKGGALISTLELNGGAEQQQ